ncbi:hypothetical protein GNF10_16400 [Nostoc sp. UCD121]|uniref:hypothetical protein n=1 Tax=unclassified Nostoc TaxID=2593658 RepID=UPI0016254906|nr:MULTISPECIES: hypothetical protein [unclassified Nostoc]MBC1221480.1 hypothetical protein [Nostoc sp. UCD120]MBC1277495.1 hypothetical protein [Nostoc sp. UCD121]MBC1294797.1 hypothetical protein [Nostoc sp. UCD122]
MKNKITAIVVALGSAIFTAPAHALTATSTVPVSVTVPEVLYLRTINLIDITLTAQELGLPGTGNTFVESVAPGSFTTNSPFTGADAIKKQINSVYAIWSNSSAGTTAVDITVDTAVAPKNAANVALPLTIDPESNITDASANGLFSIVSGGTTSGAGAVGSVTLEVDASTVLAGSYTGGSINITAVTP